jgi:PIN domain nuclease of toxin-antitoxin system
MASLPHHRDPFDRMLAAQAIVDNLTLVSVDAASRTESRGPLRKIAYEVLFTFKL